MGKPKVYNEGSLPSPSSWLETDAVPRLLSQRVVKHQACPHGWKLWKPRLMAGNWDKNRLAQRQSSGLLTADDVGSSPIMIPKKKNYFVIYVEAKEIVSIFKNTKGMS